MDKPAITSVPINDIIARRWSPRAFDPKKKVTREQILTLLEAARWAPSCFNDQPWRYLVWIRDENEELWRKAFECLGSFNRKWVNNAPVLMASIAHQKFTHNNKPNRWGMHDTGAASMSLVLQATALGLAAHQMGGFDQDGLRDAFGIPEDFIPMAMIAIGYMDDIETMVEEFRKREMEPRERNPLEEHFFSGEWGKGF